MKLTTLIHQCQEAYLQVHGANYTRVHPSNYAELYVGTLSTDHHKRSYGNNKNHCTTALKMKDCYLVATGEKTTFKRTDFYKSDPMEIVTISVNGSGNVTSRYDLDKYVLDEQVERNLDIKSLIRWVCPYKFERDILEYEKIMVSGGSAHYLNEHGNCLIVLESHHVQMGYELKDIVDYLYADTDRLSDHYDMFYLREYFRHIGVTPTRSGAFVIHKCKENEDLSGYDVGLTYVSKGEINKCGLTGPCIGSSDPKVVKGALDMLMHTEDIEVIIPIEHLMSMSLNHLVFEVETISGEIIVIQSVYNLSGVISKDTIKVTLTGFMVGKEYLMLTDTLPFVNSELEHNHHRCCITAKGLVMRAADYHSKLFPNLIDDIMCDTGTDSLGGFILYGDRKIAFGIHYKQLDYDRRPLQISNSLEIAVKAWKEAGGRSHQPKEKVTPKHKVVNKSNIAFELNILTQRLTRAIDIDDIDEVKKLINSIEDMVSQLK
tara:strand:- start:49998 stop:51464 length:1467 start_codon:yes stop_codon:yes gene_type:complete